MYVFLQVIFYVLGALAIVWILIAVAGSLPILSFAKARLEPLDDAAARICLGNAMSSDLVDPEWARANGFQPTGAYRVTNMAGSPRVVAWSRAGQRTYLCLYQVPGAPITMDLVTMFDGGVLTTGTTKDGQLLPTPSGSWVQTFSVRQADQLWGYHEAAMNHLASVEGVQYPAGQPQVEDDFALAMRRHAEHVRSLLLWPLRVPYWFFVRRNVRHNKSVAQLMGD